MSPARRAAALALLLLAAGCVPLRTAPHPDPEAGDWPRVRDAHTRGVKLYDGLATRAFATATWESPAVRAARVERTAEWKGMTAPERAQLEAAERAEAAEFEDFTLAIFTAEREDNDLDAPRSTWRVALVAGDAEALALQVSQLRADPLLRTLYPQIGDFDVVYRVRFKKLAGAPRALTLRLAGPRGRMDFPFQAAPSPAELPAPIPTPGEPGVPSPAQR